jgi:MFS family permease
MRGVLIDLTPLRRSRDFRALVGGQAVSMLGTQMTAVAVPYQVYGLTHSSLDVGLVSVALVPPLILGALIGGALIDAIDRRRLLLVVQLVMAAGSAALAINAVLGPALWPLFVFPALTAGLGGLDDSAHNAIIPNLLPRADVSTANAMFQALFQIGAILGPAIAGLLLAGAELRFVYWIDVATFAAALVAVFLISPQPPAGGGRTASLRSIAEGVRFTRGRQAIQGAFLIDLSATVFGMPRALFPALAATVFGGGAATVGFLYAAPGAGALLGAVTTGWVAGVVRQGRAVIIAVIVWGSGDCRLRADLLAASRLAAARGGRLGRRHLRGLPRHHRPTRRARRFPGPPHWLADRGRQQRPAPRRP